MESKSKLPLIAQRVASILLIASSFFALYTSGFGLLSAMTQRSVHWFFMIVAIFLLYPMRKSREVGVVDLLLALLAAASTLYVTFTWERNALRIADPAIWEIALCVLGIMLVLEATRRSMGMAMPIIAIIALAYAFLGPYMPGALKHKGFSISSLASFIYTTSEGIFGMAMGTSATYIIVFVLFGSFLAKSGAGQLFVDLSLAATGRKRSGPAQATILSNALMGIISGSPVANVVTTGSFTLPLLRSAKYPMVEGASILAVAATGSMFTPPVMGAAAFLIADYLSEPYGNVVLAAVVPALLFYLSLVIYADITAAKNGLTGLKREDLPDWKAAFLDRGQLLIPIVLLIVLIVNGWSALKSAFWCVILIVVLAMIKKSTRMNLTGIKDALVAGSKDTLSIAAACACAGIIVGVVSATGLGVKFSSLLMQIAGNSPILALFLTMVAAIIMGMGLPPTAVYIIMAALTVPALTGIGIAPMAAHFFVFYFSCVGAITPPVALAAYSASAVAHTDPFKTGWTAFRMGLVAYIIPYIFAFNPVLLLQGGGNILETVLALATAVIGVFFFTFASEGYCKGWLHPIPRLLFLGGAVCMMIPGMVTDAAGVAILAVGLVLGRFLKGSPPAKKAAAEEPAEQKEV
ncbi:TRAP transporter fused permease subunit [Pseudoflavonifractor phocaeensis]|uniref:TRAP transporter permease n=1 Tax=Pseudoflavonifractor phocaeensis TaxID=1870988 RepID=UPI00313DA478